MPTYGRATTEAFTDDPQGAGAGGRERERDPASVADRPADTPRRIDHRHYLDGEPAYPGELDLDCEALAIEFYARFYEYDLTAEEASSLAHDPYARPAHGRSLTVFRPAAPLVFTGWCCWPFATGDYAIGLGRYEIAPSEVIDAGADGGRSAGCRRRAGHRLQRRDAYPAAAYHRFAADRRELAVTGVAFQGIFRNPLVDSNILGVTSGAGFGAALMLLISAGAGMVQLSAFGFGLLAVFLAYTVSRLYYSAPLLVLTLVGILIGSFFGSLTSVLKYIADPLDSLPAITYWLMGSLADVTMSDIPLLLIISVVGMAFMWAVRWRLNVLSLGDHEAQALGLNPTRLKLMIILFSTLMTSVACRSAGDRLGGAGDPHARGRSSARTTSA